MKTKVFIGTSLDGFIARKNGDIDWLEQYANEEAVQAYEEFISTIDAIVIGRGTFEKVLSFPEWPYKMSVFLLSNTIKQVPDKVKEKVNVLSMMPRQLLNYLASQGYSSIYVDGGKVIQDFLKEDLVDDLIISKAPVLIGSGIPLFGHLDIDLLFKHVSTDVYSNGLVRSVYERNRPST
jgi:dihydrofolate reductase